MGDLNKNFWKREDNQEVEGFSFDKNDFEDLIENYILINDIPVLLGVTESELDTFCKHVYNLTYEDAYRALHIKADAHNKKAFNMLAKDGNQTAMKIVAEHFMQIGRVVDNDNSITFVCDVPNVPSDEENVK